MSKQRGGREGALQRLVSSTELLLDSTAGEPGLPPDTSGQEITARSPLQLFWRRFREDLAAGLGWRGRLRALWALPPRRGR